MFSESPVFRSVPVWLRVLMISALVPMGVSLWGQQTSSTQYMEDPGEESPSAHRGIPLKLGSVDAVSGEINLRIPLGPKMPGRVPIGFCYSYDSQNGYHMLMGGDFRPVVWPSTDVKRLMYTVTVNGAHYNFARNFEVPNLVNPLAFMAGYGIDNGEQAAANYASAYTTSMPLTVGAFVSHVFQSMDGKSFFVTSAWKIVPLVGEA
jgi:hypothetical protein